MYKFFYRTCNYDYMSLLTIHTHTATVDLVKYNARGDCRERARAEQMGGPLALLGRGIRAA